MSEHKETKICHFFKISASNSPRFHRPFPVKDLLIVSHSLACYRFNKCTLSQIPACYSQAPKSAVKGNTDKVAVHTGSAH